MQLNTTQVPLPEEESVVYERVVWRSPSFLAEDAKVWERTGHLPALGPPRNQPASLQDLPKAVLIGYPEDEMPSPTEYWNWDIPRIVQTLPVFINLTSLTIANVPFPLEHLLPIVKCIRRLADLSIHHVPCLPMSWSPEGSSSLYTGSTSFPRTLSQLSIRGRYTMSDTTRAIIPILTLVTAQSLRILTVDLDALECISGHMRDSRVASRWNPTAVVIPIHGKFPFPVVLNLAPLHSLTVIGLDSRRYEVHAHNSVHTRLHFFVLSLSHTLITLRIKGCATLFSYDEIIEAEHLSNYAGPFCWANKLLYTGHQLTTIILTSWIPDYTQFINCFINCPRSVSVQHVHLPIQNDTLAVIDAVKTLFPCLRILHVVLDHESLPKAHLSQLGHSVVSHLKLLEALYIYGLNQRAFNANDSRDIAREFGVHGEHLQSLRISETEEWRRVLGNEWQKLHFSVDSDPEIYVT
ncbi:hypothetical protein V5O48_007699 [Marasmius crinis-equi]|uniref:Uncharacterized protein n=1 Tax=Marasmius crinis-equi TaxID=585013 RepID=A0ABR3FFX2_9AGAR